jgi:hypothetical protein
MWSIVHGLAAGSGRDRGLVLPDAAIVRSVGFESFGSRSNIVFSSTYGTPLKPTGLLLNQSHAIFGFWPLRKPYFSRVRDPSR